MNTQLNDYDSSSDSDDYEYEQNKLQKSKQAPHNRTPTSGLEMYPTQQPFLIFCSNRGVEHICNEVYKSLCNYDPTFWQANITELQLQYVTTIAYINRMVQCSIKNVYCMCIEDTEYLKLVANSIMLPSFLTKYIESLGVYPMRSGISVAPWVADYKKLFAPELQQRSPEQILLDAGREIPKDAWKLDIEWIGKYIEANFYSKYKFTKVDNRNFVGKVEMIITPQSSYLGNNMCVPTSPQNACDMEARLGVFYEWRSRNNEREWPGQSSLVLTNLFRGRECNKFQFFYEYGQKEPQTKAPRGSKQSSRLKKAHYSQNITATSNSTELMMFPIQRHFLIFCSNRGIERICKPIYKMLSNMDSSFTELQLQYVTTIAYINRLVQCGFSNDFIVIPDTYSLEHEANAIELPLFLTKYIESLGAYSIKSGVCVAPWVAEYGELFAPQLEQRSPEQILHAAGRNIPDNAWKLDSGWIMDFKLLVGRIRSKYPFAKVDNTKFEGRVEMIITPIDNGDDFLPTSPEITFEEKAKLGAYYEWRSRNNEKDWPGESTKILQDILQGTECNKLYHPTLYNLY